MKLPRKIPSLRGRFPLLRKELIEQAARLRTYVIRLLYATVLFLIFCLTFRTRLQSAGPSPEQLLGWGAEVFKLVMILQFVGIYVFLPAIMSGVLTLEKERDSLALLMLTDLRPWEIVLEKYFGRLVPMFTFLLLSMPLMGLAYSMGGITTNMLVNGVLLLILACLQVGAASLMFSAYCRTTVTSFLCSYLIGAAICNCPPFSSLFLFLIMPNESPLLVALASIGTIATIVAFLFLSKRFLVRRAFLPPKNVTLELFHGLDRFWSSMNRYAGNVVLIKEKTGLPENEPVHWRETTKRSLGKVNYLFRVLMLIETPILFIAVFMSYLGRSDQTEGLSWMIFLLWFGSMIAVAVRSADVIASERANQTLDVLISTPLSTKEIISQKMRSVWRLILILWVPLVSVAVMELLFRGDFSRDGRSDKVVAYAVSSFLTMAIYLPMFAWVSLWIGLKVHSRARAVILTVAAIILWCALPVAGFSLLNQLNILISSSEFDHRIGLLLAFASPATMIAATELESVWRALFLRDYSTTLIVDRWAVILFNFLFYYGILCYFRWLCLNRTDRYLRHYRGTERVQSEDVLVAEELNGIQNAE